MKIKEKSIIIISVIIVATAAVIFFITLPLKQKISQIEEDINNQKVVLEITKKRSKNITSLQRDYEEIMEKKENLENMFIGKNNQLTLFKDIEKIAEQYNLELNYNLEESSTKEDISEVNLSLNLSGLYQNILKYLGSIEELNYYIKIKDITLKSSSTKENIQVVINAKTYWQ